MVTTASASDQTSPHDSNNKPRIYLDHNACAPLRPEVIATLIEVLSQQPFQPSQPFQSSSPSELQRALKAPSLPQRLLVNPMSLHATGRYARGLLGEARRSVASMVGVHPEDVLFTSGGTEANALAVRPFNAFLTGMDAHPSLHPLQGEERVLLDSEGRWRLDSLEAILSSKCHQHENSHVPSVERREERRIHGDGERHEEAERKGLLRLVVACTLAHGDTGVVQDWRSIVDCARRYGAAVHIDAVQAFGKIPLNVGELFAHGVWSVSMSAHKMGGPTGVGALLCHPRWREHAQQCNLSPSRLIHPTGGQEKGYRRGTHNMLGIVGMGKAATLALSPHALARSQTLTSWHQALERHLLATKPDNVVVGSNALRLPQTTCVLLPPNDAMFHLMRLDLAGIDVSAGSACTSGTQEVAPVLLAMGVPVILAKTMIRITSGWSTTRADLAAVAFALTQRQCHELTDDHADHADHARHHHDPSLCVDPELSRHAAVSP